MKKYAVLIVLVVIGFISFSNDVNKAQSETYRVPITGRWDITRTDCSGHSGTGRYMDLNIDTIESTNLSFNSSLGSAVDYGAPVYASHSGQVTIAEPNGTSYGSLIEISDSSTGIYSRYAHIGLVLVEKDSLVSKGDLIAFVGDKGTPNNYHLHWEMGPESTIDLYSYFSNEIQLDLNAPKNKGDSCVAESGVGEGSYKDDGYLDGASLSGYADCPDIWNQNYPEVVLFDASDCRGNIMAVPNIGQFYNLDQYGFNDRVRSISMRGKSVLMGPDVYDTTKYNYCWNNDMWNTDIDKYFNTSGVETDIKIGWDPQDTTGYNMISWVQVFNNTNCSGQGNNLDGNNVPLKSSITNQPSVGGVSNGQYGDSAVDIRAEAFCTNTQYGWDEATNGFFEIPDYLDNRTSCIDVDSGFSLMVYKDQSGLGASRCFNHTVNDLQNAYLNDGTNANNVLSSVEVFADSDCNGQLSYGLADGDMITVWENSNYSGQSYGWHDTGNYNPSGLVNNVSAIGVMEGWSVLVYEDANQTGAQSCFSESDFYLDSNAFNNGNPVDNNIDSLTVFYDTDCGGWNPSTPTPVATNTQTSTPLPTATSTSTPTQGQVVDSNGVGLTAKYFDGMDLSNLVDTRIDPMININTSGSPNPAVGIDGFSVEWTGFIESLYSETYEICTISDDGVRVYLNGQLFIDNWTDHAPTENCGYIDFVAGLEYDVKVEFYENTGGATAELYWSSASQAKVAIPQSQLYPVNQPDPTQTPLPIIATATIVPTSQQAPASVNLSVYQITGSTVARITACVSGVDSGTYSLLDAGDGWYDNTIQGNTCVEVDHDYLNYGTFTVTFIAQPISGDVIQSVNVQLVQSTETPVSQVTGIELLDTAWYISAQSDSFELYQSMNGGELIGMDTLRVTYDLRGLQALNGDASAIIIDQNGWNMISLSDYGQNGYDGVQTVDIPLSDFQNVSGGADLDVTQSVGTLHTRFWYGSPYIVEILSIKALSLGVSPTAIPTLTLLPTNTVTPIPAATNTMIPPIANVVLSVTQVGTSTVARITACVSGVDSGTYSLLDAGDGWYDNTIQGNTCIEIDHDYLAYGMFTVTFIAQPISGDVIQSANVELLLPPTSTATVTPIPAATNTPVPTSTEVPTSTATSVPPTATIVSQGIELLDAPWYISAQSDAFELYQSINGDELLSKSSLQITYNLHGLCALGGDASAIIIDQNGWNMISLSDYGANCLDGVQVVDIPLSDFRNVSGGIDLDVTQSVGTLHTRFWYGSPYTVDITSIIAQ